jgi:hypothetical protein
VCVISVEKNQNLFKPLYTNFDFFKKQWAPSSWGSIYITALGHDSLQYRFLQLVDNNTYDDPFTNGPIIGIVLSEDKTCIVRHIDSLSTPLSL